MAQQLGNVETIGGVAVAIGADLSGLRGGIAAAKAIAAGAEKDIKVTIDTTRAKTELQSLTRARIVAEEQVTAAYARANATRLDMARRAGEAEGAAYANALARSTQRMSVQASGANDKEGFLSTGNIIRGYLALRIISQGLRFGANSLRARGEIGSSDPLTAAQGRENLLKAGKDVFVAGQAVEVADALTGFRFGYSRKTGFTADPRKTYGEILHQNIEDVKTAQEASTTARSQGYELAAREAESRGDAIGLVRAKSEIQIAAAKRLVLAGGGGEAVKNVEREKMLRDTAIQDAVSQSRDRTNLAYASSGAMGLVGQAVGERRRGLGDQAFQTESLARFQDVRATGDARLVGVKDPAERKRIQIRNDTEYALAQAQQQDQFAERQKSKAADVAQTIATTQQQTLRLSNKNYEADLAAFDAVAKAKVDAIDDLAEKQNQTTRNAAQRAVLVNQQEKQITSEKLGYAAAGYTALLRAHHQTTKAALVAFDAETERGLIGKDARLAGEYAASRRTERTALLEEQRQGQVNTDADFRTRVAEAGARGKGQNVLAGVIGTISGLRERLRGTDPKDVKSEITAETAELKSMQDQIMRPNRYATSGGDYEARGGPGGDKGNEQTTILKLIRDYLKEIKDRPPAPVF